MAYIKYHSTRSMRCLSAAATLVGTLVFGIFLVQSHAATDFLATKNIINVARADSPTTDGGCEDGDCADDACGNASPGEVADSQTGGCDAGDGK